MLAKGTKAPYFEGKDENGNTVKLTDCDSAASHQRFIAKYELPFHLIADTDLAILKAYEAWGEKKMYGK